MALESNTAIDSSNNMTTPTNTETTNTTTQTKCKETQQIKTTEFLQFVQQSREKLNNILGKIRWQEQTFLNSGKSVPEQLIQSKNVTKIEKELLPTSCATTHSVRLSAAEIEQLLGDSFKYPGDACTLADLQINYTREQRLKIYEYVLQRTTTTTEECSKVKKIETLDLEPVTSEHLEIGNNQVLPQRRYRISRPTFREELHELVDQQMRALAKKCTNGVQEKQQERRSSKLHKCERERSSRNSKSMERTCITTSYNRKDKNTNNKSYIDKSTKIEKLDRNSHSKHRHSRRERSRSRSRRKRSKSHEKSSHREHHRHRSRSKHKKTSYKNRDYYN